MLFPNSVSEAVKIYVASLDECRRRELIDGCVGQLHYPFHSHTVQDVISRFNLAENWALINDVELNFEYMKMFYDLSVTQSQPLFVAVVILDEARSVILRDGVGS